MKIASRVVSTLLPLLLLTVAVAAAPRAEGAPSPRSVLGFEPGEDRKLADWPQIVAYFKQLDAASDRIQAQQIGLSTLRRPFIVAFISSAENLRNLERIRESQRKLADPRLIANDAERERLIRETPAIVAITCSIHSTEIVASQMAMELAYRLASDDSQATANILRNTVVLLIPSVNPDGIDISPTGIARRSARNTKAQTRRSCITTTPATTTTATGSCSRRSRRNWSQNSSGANGSRRLFTTCISRGNSARACACRRSSTRTTPTLTR
ncbi:MAG TPA: M14 family zinc carboxypeptidase [Blastocatellia bacterium]|nr:M14 family zinc carboxypeptidase [Blastocatellia bacterium]